MTRVTILTRFHTKLLAGMMLVVVALTVLGCFLTQREVLSEAKLNMQDDFQNELANLHRVQEVRNTVITELCRDLVMRPRIHAALEDNALDILCLTAGDELREIMGGKNEPGAESSRSTLIAKFYRFLDVKGSVIPPPDATCAGQLSAIEEAQLSLPRLPENQQVGYIVRRTDNAAPTINEVIAFPIVSTRTGEIISSLVLGFEPTTTSYFRTAGPTRSGIFVENDLVFPGLSPITVTQLANDLVRVIALPGQAGISVPVHVAGEPCLLFHNQINPGSLFAPGYEVVIPPEAREIIFERFHRASIGENIPGHGLGLNLARDLARLPGGDLRLKRSDEKWTEFEVRFRLFVPGSDRFAPVSRCRSDKPPAWPSWATRSPNRRESAGSGTRASPGARGCSSTYHPNDVFQGLIRACLRNPIIFS